MREYETTEVRGGMLEYFDDTHTYVYEGIVLPSITQILETRFKSKYKGVPKSTLDRAAQLGTAVHEAIEMYEKEGQESELEELRNWKFLKKAYNFECVGNEIPVVLFHEDEPIACGRFDLLLEQDGKLGLGDIKRTATLDKMYLAYQLNLYRIAYQQCYGKDIEFLRGVHLREQTRKYVPIPIDEEFILEFIEQYRKENK